MALQNNIIFANCLATITRTEQNRYRTRGMRGIYNISYDSVGTDDRSKRAKTEQVDVARIVAVIYVLLRRGNIFQVINSAKRRENERYRNNVHFRYTINCSMHLQHTVRIIITHITI